MKLGTRKLGTCVVLLAVAASASGQQPPPAPDRYGIAANFEAYPLNTPKEAAAAVVRALDKGRVEYFAAQILDPAFVDARVADRARYLEEEVERDLRILREKQRGAPLGVDRVPTDPAGLDAAVKAEARRRAFRLFAQDIRALLAENPDHLKDLRRFLRDADYTEAGDQAKATLRDVKDRELFFRRIGLRWYVLDTKKELPPLPEKK